MALSPEEFVDLNRQARRRAERAAQTMSSQGVSSEEYLKKLRAKRRPTRRFEVSETPAAVEIGEEPLPPGYDKHVKRSATATRPPARPRESSPTRPTRTPSAPRPVPSHAKANPRASPTIRSPSRASLVSRVSFRKTPKSQQDLLKTAAKSSTTSLSSAKTIDKPKSTKTPKSAIPKNKKSIRRAASAAALYSKAHTTDEKTRNPKTKPSRSRSVQAVIPPEDPLPQVTLTKRSSLRSIRDKIRRVASAFELRPGREDDAEKSGGISMKHNNSTRSLLRYSATRIRRRRLDTVDEET
ncbi:hypothetical protein C8034_v006305 [Colletotrichum sidae]|uniref:Uncharacterized protein n=1 Tax=Colletotrichum sidae TaxID=1347389 RepID=A0A4R8TU99_9PEZI|nr:hypothetical protein C8034_v006305 [Colletotrichum sidae]